MYIYSDDKTMIIGCMENGIAVMFANHIPAWVVFDAI
jgi:hypothetical protein